MDTFYNTLTRLWCDDKYLGKIGVDLLKFNYITEIAILELVTASFSTINATFGIEKGSTLYIQHGTEGKADDFNNGVILLTLTNCIFKEFTVEYFVARSPSNAKTIQFKIIVEGNLELHVGEDDN